MNTNPEKKINEPNLLEKKVETKQKTKWNFTKSIYLFIRKNSFSKNKYRSYLLHLKPNKMNKMIIMCWLEKKILFSKFLLIFIFILGLTLI